MRFTSFFRLVPLLLIPLTLGVGCADKGANGPDGGAYRTSDGGKTWEAIQAFPGTKSIGSIATTDILALEADPQDHLVLYAGTKSNGILTSLNGGETWQQPVATALTTGRVDDIEVDPKSVCTYFVAQLGKLQRTTTCGRTFEAIYNETRENVRVTEVAVDPINTQIVWIGLSNGDVLHSLNGGATWAASLQGKKSVSRILIRSTNPAEVLVATDGQGIYKTTDAGATWKDGREPVRAFKNADNVKELSQTHDGGVVVAATEYGVLRSVDFGATWETLTLLTPPGKVLIPSIAVSPTDPKTIVYTAGSTLYVSNDAGVNWATTELPSSRTDTTLLLDPSVKTVLYLGAATPDKK